jgi:hypothetical protein
MKGFFGGQKRQIVLSILAALLLVVVVVSVASASPAFPHAQRTVLTGTEERTFGAPGSHWTTPDGKTEVRDLPLAGHFSYSGDGVKLAGPDASMVSATLDGINGFTWGTMIYTDAATKYQCSGAAYGTITDGLGTLTIYAVCTDGSLLKGTLSDRETVPAGVAPPTSVRSDFKGVLMSRGKR